MGKKGGTLSSVIDVEKRAFLRLHQRYPMKKLLPTALLTLLAVTACSPQLAVKVDAIVNKDLTSEKKTYVLRSAMQEVTPNDLYFREYSRYVRKALQRQGFQAAQTSAKADMAIYFSYGISEGKIVHETYTRPVYATVGGHSIDITETERDASGTKRKTTKTIDIPFRREIVGVEQRTKTFEIYTAHMVLEATDSPDNEGEDITGGRNRLWKTVVSTTSKMNDLRQIMPMMVAAAAPYMGADTGEAITVKMEPDDPQVIRLRDAGR